MMLNDFVCYLLLCRNVLLKTELITQEWILLNMETIKNLHFLMRSVKHCFVLFTDLKFNLQVNFSLICIYKRTSVIKLWLWISILKGSFCFMYSCKFYMLICLYGFQVQHQMGNEETYFNFMRCIHLYACNLISGSELVAIIEPFVV